MESNYNKDCDFCRSDYEQENNGPCPGGCMLIIIGLVLASYLIGIIAYNGWYQHQYNSDAYGTKFIYMHTNSDTTQVYHGEFFSWPFDRMEKQEIPDNAVHGYLYIPMDITRLDGKMRRVTCSLTYMVILDSLEEKPELEYAMKVQAHNICRKLICNKSDEFLDADLPKFKQMMNGSVIAVTEELYPGLKVSSIDINI